MEEVRSKLMVKFPEPMEPKEVFGMATNCEDPIVANSCVRLQFIHAKVRAEC